MGNTNGLLRGDSSTVLRDIGGELRSHAVQSNAVQKSGKQIV